MPLIGLLLGRTQVRKESDLEYISIETSKMKRRTNTEKEEENTQELWNSLKR
jgi:hypothetical protein